MIIDSILTLLKDDSVLKDLLGATVLNSKIHMFKTVDGIAYRFIHLTSDKIKEQSRLEITVVNNDYARACIILERVKTILLTFADSKLNDDILSVELNGGGCIENEDTKAIHLKANFIIVNKYRGVN